MTRIKFIILTMRPKQWVKNSILFVPLIFSQNLFLFDKFSSALFAVLIFCLLSGGTYVFNDIKDIIEDRNHPLKSQRPIAAGLLTVSDAKIASLLIVTIALILSFFINHSFAIAAGVYFMLQIMYSTFIKNIVILDVFFIASGFVLRVLSGAIAVDVSVSSWLLVCTFSLSLFLGLCKRRHELTNSGAVPSQHRIVLGEYKTLFIDQMVAVIASSTVISYSMYTLSSATIQKFNTENLVFSVPFVIFGIFRYLFLVYAKSEGGNPELLLFSDRPLLLAIGLYGLFIISILYL